MIRYAGHEETTKEKIAILMADGRERTTADIARALGRTTVNQRTHIQSTMKELHQLGIVTRENVQGFAIYRASQ